MRYIAAIICLVAAGFAADAGHENGSTSLFVGAIALFVWKASES